MEIGTFYEYKGFTGSIEYDAEENIHYGKLLNIDDFVNYHGEDVIELYDNFKNAVDDYIEICNKVGKKIITKG